MIPYPRDFLRFFRISSTAAALATITPHTRRPLATAARPAALSPRTARALVGVGAGAARPAPAEPPPRPTLASPRALRRTAVRAGGGGELGPRRPGRPRGVPGLPAWRPPAPGCSGGRACASRAHAGVSGGQKTPQAKRSVGGGTSHGMARRARAPRARRRRRGGVRAGSTRTGHAGEAGNARGRGGGAPGRKKSRPAPSVERGVGGRSSSRSSRVVAARRGCQRGSHDPREGPCPTRRPPGRIPPEGDGLRPALGLFGAAKAATPNAKRGGGEARGSGGWRARMRGFCGGVFARGWVAWVCGAGAPSGKENWLDLDEEVGPQLPPWGSSEAIRVEAESHLQGGKGGRGCEN